MMTLRSSVEGRDLSLLVGMLLVVILQPTMRKANNEEGRVLGDITGL